MYRQEYPRPQMVRQEWLNLNGKWQFQFDDEDYGIQQQWMKNAHTLEQEIEVPFAYQTELSGINDKACHDIVWYKKTVSIPEKWRGQQIKLNFGAVDYRCQLYVNEQYIGSHEGGHVSFSFDITDALNWHEESIALRVEDPTTDETIPRGKQSWQEESTSIWYSRTTGIWQTVWLEPLANSQVVDVKYTPDVPNLSMDFEFELSEACVGKDLLIDISFKGEQIVKDTVYVVDSNFSRRIGLIKNKIFQHSYHGPDKSWLWTPEFPNLFDVTFTIKEEATIFDQVDSYFGLRSVHTENGMVYLNNRPYYQKLVLNQGYWREGLLTAPSDKALKKDILLTKEMGFNGCRMHQKVEDPRFLYWADQLGLLVWGECPSFVSYDNKAINRMTKEWFEILERDYNHPSIITWVPTNESWGVPDIRTSKQQQAFALAIYHMIKSLDPTRLVISNDGWEMPTTDICAIHNYNHGNADETAKYQNFKTELATKEGLLSSKSAGRDIYLEGYQHEGEPILLTEFGGIAFELGSDKGWGYSSASDAESFIADYQRVMEAVYESEALHGYCYTQLTDVEQEINGLLTYDREPKCELSKIKAVNDMWHCEIVK